MRMTNLASTPANTAIPISSPPAPGAAGCFGLHALRLVDGLLLDFPIPSVAGSRCWVATIWPDARTRSGWAGVNWSPGVVEGRGWVSPARIAVGDIVEFGVETAGRRRNRSTARSFGVIVDYDGTWLLSVQGPYDDPAAAHVDAIRIVQDRQAPPALPPPPEPPPSSRHRGRVSTHGR